MRWNISWPARAVAALTVSYSAALVIEPAVLAKPCGLTDAGGRVPPATAQLIRSIGLRDAALAAAWGLVPAGYPMTVLTAARVLSDGADAVWFGKIAPRRQRAKIVAAAAGWAALEAAVGALARRK